MKFWHEFDYETRITKHFSQWYLVFSFKANIIFIIKIFFWNYHNNQPSLFLDQIQCYEETNCLAIKWKSVKQPV